MSANLRLGSSIGGGEVMVAALTLAAVIALGGCAMSEDQPSGGDATMESAAMCEEQHQTAEEQCVQRYDPIESPEQLQSCRDQALGDLQDCREG
jgi:hypothetical protein